MLLVRIIYEGNPFSFPALSDLLLNIALLIRVAQDLAGGKVHQLCIAISFLSHLAELLSALLTVLFTIQRFTAVRYPLQTAVGSQVSPFLSIILIISSSFLFCLLLSLKNKHIDCHEELELSWYVADALLSFVIPFTLVLIFNVLIINLIRKHARSPLGLWEPWNQPLRFRRIRFNLKRRQDTSRMEKYSMSYSYSPQPISRQMTLETDFTDYMDSKCSMNANGDRESFIKDHEESKRMRNNTWIEINSNEQRDRVSPVRFQILFESVSLFLSIYQLNRMAQLIFSSKHQSFSWYREVYSIKLK